MTSLHPLYAWHDLAWMKTRDQRGKPDLPIAVYQVHLGSWMRVPEENYRPLTCEEIAPRLAAYVQALHFTHVALLSVNEHDSAGELRPLIDYLHQQDIGVILDSRLTQEFSKEIFERYHADGFVGDDALVMATAGWPLKLKTDRRWSHDVLEYFGGDPLYRKYHHDLLTVRADYAFSENFILPLSRAEVSSGKGSLLARMPGDAWRKFANLRLLFACLYAQPGKKLLFMGGEFAQWREWNPDASLDWHLVQEGNNHRAMQRWVADLNLCYQRETALHQTDANPQGFEWADCSGTELSTLGWLRHNASGGEVILAMFNFTPVPRHNYRVGVPGGGFWREILNSDAHEYGGSGQGNLGGVEAAPFGWQSKSHSITVTLPPLGAVFFKREP